MMSFFVKNKNVLKNLAKFSDASKLAVNSNA